MNEFNKKCVSIKENSMEELREKYTSILKDHQQYLSKKISKLISEQSNMEKLIDEQFITEIKYNGMQTINELAEDLDKTIELIINNSYDKEPNKKELFSLYIKTLKNVIQRNQMEWIDIEIDDFTNTLIKNTKESLNSPEQNKIIINKIKEIMKEYRNKLIQDYNEIQKEFVNKIISQISSLINETDFIKLRTSEYERFSELLTLSNYELIEENGVFYSLDKSNQEKFELFLDKGTLNSKNHKLKFVIDEETLTRGFINNETTQGIVIKKENDELEKINLTSVKNNTIITIYKLEGNYNFERNLKPITNIKEIKSILIEIRDNYPGIFNKLIHDRDLKPIVDKIIEYNKKVAEIIKKRNEQKSQVSSTTETNISKEDRSKKKN